MDAPRRTATSPVCTSSPVRRTNPADGTLRLTVTFAWWPSV